ncbi:Hypothetical_protein [Hexamita inflata]|uniref:Hypothetical_protein n=1 Tax=Hexamita inflata TaxID=28002 RepID=A0AA86Q2D2_9EUKA|nr:Hypothetical protein HINF_LOCUS38524 [Hexamita inflata]
MTEIHTINEKCDVIYSDVFNNKLKYNIRIPIIYFCEQFQLLSSREESVILLFLFLLITLFFKIKTKSDSRTRKQVEWRDIACGAIPCSSINGNQYNENVEIHTINEFLNVKYFSCQQLISVFGGGYNNFLYQYNLYTHTNIKIAAGLAPSRHSSEL